MLCTKLGLKLSSRSREDFNKGEILRLDGQTDRQTNRLTDERRTLSDQKRSLKVLLNFAEWIYRFEKRRKVYIRADGQTDRLINGWTNKRWSEILIWNLRFGWAKKDINTRQNLGTNFIDYILALLKYVFACLCNHHYEEFIDNSSKLH